MRSEGRGRPRLEQSRRPGKTAREEILDAAAELFTNLGYASTSQREVIEECAVRRRRPAVSAGRIGDQPSLRRHRLPDDSLDADGALRTLGFDGDFTKLHKLTAVRLGFADTVQV